MWASSQLVGELRRTNDILQELVGTLHEFLRPAEGDWGRDLSPVTLDDVEDEQEKDESVGLDQFQALMKEVQAAVESGDTVKFEELKVKARKLKEEYDSSQQEGRIDRVQDVM